MSAADSASEPMQPTAPGSREPMDRAAARVHGWCDPRLRRVREVFTEHFTQGEEAGASACVYLGDDLAVELWGGVADVRTGRPWQRDTPCVAFSCTKALTATCALRLWQEGAYDVDGPVTAWWPEFGRHGKDRATAAHLLSHQVGLPAFDTPVSVAETTDPAALAERLAAQAPVWEPGTAHGYHALTFGWLAGEIVRRLSGQTVGEYIARHIAGPHQLDIWLGPPDDVIERAARLTARKPGPPDPPARTKTKDDAKRLPRAGITRAAAGMPVGTAADAAAPGGAPGAEALARMNAALGDQSSLLFRSFSIPDTRSVPGGSNNPDVMRAGWPASGALVTAPGLAGFYRQLIAGRILEPATLRSALVPRARGADRLLLIESSFGLGFMRPAWTFPTPPAGAESAFGHTGIGGAIGLADPRHGIAMAYIPNRMGDETSGGLRAYRLVEAVYDSIA
ncbi:MAG: serine hydrolase domain-containing protein [Micromonosporaceae bacterium]